MILHVRQKKFLVEYKPDSLLYMKSIKENDNLENYEYYFYYN